MFGFAVVWSQEDSLAVANKDSLKISGNIQQEKLLNMLSPAKAAFYSAVLPGLGQAYNKQYWKIPLVYGAIGAGMYFYIQNSNEYERFRTAYFNRKNGLPDEFPLYNDNVLIDAQQFYRKQRDTALMLTVLAYFLNIIDANVSAHLKQWNINDNLSLRMTEFSHQNQPAFGMSLNFTIGK